MNSTFPTGSATLPRILALAVLAGALPVLGDARPAADGGDTPACLVVTNSFDGGEGSLRAAIECANSHPGVDTITFAIPGDGPHHIGIVSPLPAITEAVVIDGFSQTGSRPNGLSADGNDAVIKIVLDGVEAGYQLEGASRVVKDGIPVRDIVDALVLRADGCRIQGLDIQRFPGVGIAVESSHNQIQGNFIGTDADGVTPAGNSRMGIDIRGGHENRIGGLLAADVNRIAFNQDVGVRVTGGGAASGNSIVGNSIYDNRSIAIDLDDDGVTANDANDADGGPNGLQNFPVLTSAQLNNQGLVVDGTLNAAGGPFLIEFFASEGCDRSSHGGGQRFLGRLSTTPEGNEATFSATLAGVFKDTTRITATATALRPVQEPAGRRLPTPAGAQPAGELLGTSEFSRCIPVDVHLTYFDNLAVQVSDAVDPVIVGSELTYTVSVQNAGQYPGEPPTITGQTVQVTLPPGAIFVSAVGGVTPVGRVLTFSNVVVPPTGAHLDFSVRYPAIGTNSVSATVSEPGPVTADNSAQETTVVVAEPVPVISVADVTVPEGNDGLDDRDIVVRVNPAPTDSLTFYYSTAPGTASTGGDFKGVTNGIIFIPAGATAVALRVQVNGDTVEESDESFTLSFAPIPGLDLPATFDRTSMTVNILDDDTVHQHADLALQLSATPSPATAGAALTYRVAVTNRGPESAPGFLVNEVLPENVRVVDIQSAHGTVKRDGRKVDWQVDSAVPSGGGHVLTLVVVADRAGLLTNTAAVGLLLPSDRPSAAQPQGRPTLQAVVDLTDPDVSNNSATLTTVVSGGLTLENLSTNGVVLNRQTGLFEQRIRLRNASAGAIAGAHVLLRGLATGVVVRNAAGIEGGVPFVDVKRLIAAGEDVEIRVEYYVANRVPPGLPELEVRSNPTVAPAAGTNSVPALTARSQNGRFLLEFLSAPQRLYAIEYADLEGTNVSSGWKRAVPDITARANAVQWFDDGPPKTETLPTNRLYRVRLVETNGNNNVTNP